MINRKHSFAILAALAAVIGSQATQAQSSISEDFTGIATTNPWYFFNGACLTAGSANGVEPSGGVGGSMPGCTAIGASFYKENLVGGVNGVAGNAQTLPDPTGQGALRFTNGNPGGYNQNGGILSTTPFPTGQGVSITFKTVTYRGDSGGAGGDGADGISFFLMDATQLNTAAITGTANGDGNGLGSWGGSLGYTCSNANGPYNGLIGGYLGVGIDEYGNFLNGQTLATGYAGTNTATGDNSAVGYGYKPNRIGLRGAGSVAWNWLHTKYPTQYPNSLSAASQLTAVQNTCKNGYVWDGVNNKAYTTGGSTVAVPDYAPIPGAYVELPSTVQIANETAMNRGAALPIFYQLKITQNGLLSLSYSINGGAYQSVIAKQDITASNGALPANFLFGFAGSTGGSTNIHEILCFKADPNTTAASSAGASEKQSAKLETGAQAYFAYYNPSTWTGRVTASGLGLDGFGNVVIAATPNWDGSCTLTGVKAGSSCTTTGVAGPTAAIVPANRTILSWNYTQGIPFEFANLTTGATGQQTIINKGDVTTAKCNSTTNYSTSQRVAYLRGDRTCEISTLGVGLFRARSGVLADIVDSSPTWVGPPVSPYTSTWVDRINSGATIPEAATTAQTYAAYVTAAAARLNVVYVGSNDGMIHGFRSGSYDINGNFVNNGTTPNDGQEVLAYVPATVINTIHSTTANLDYSNTQYGHAFFVDATPGQGDLFYKGAWHTWLVGGLGAGGGAIFGLDVTTPTAANFKESNAKNLVMFEKNNTSATATGGITCTNVSNCYKSLGNTYGTPQIRRLHDGKWGIIFGNGYGSTNGDAGIFVMTIDPSTAVQTVYYLSAGSSSGPNNGIAYPAAADLDGDHITDYVYAGDLKGNLWRFDLTSSSESGWQVTPGPMFTTPAGQAITTQPVIASGSPSVGMQPQIMVMFGTGQKVPLSSTSPATYSTGTQSLYGVWDWNLTTWNSMSTATYASLAAGATGLSSGNHTMAQSNLQAQTVTINTTTLNRDITNNAAICWAGSPACTTTKQFGWYFNLPGTQEQVIFSPELVSQALTVNSIVPAPNNPTSCANLTDTGFTYVVNAMTGGAFNQVFLPPSEAANGAVNTDPRYTDTAAIAMQTNATGSSFITGNNAGTKFLVYETNQVETGGTGSNNILGGTLGLNLPANTTGKRISWVERR